jgi:hypothetical protein
MIGNPTEKELVGMVREKLITNCPATVHDVHNANRIFGPDLANLRGKTTRRKPEHVRVDYAKILWDLVDMHKYVTLVADVMFVKGLPFLVTSSRRISSVTIEYLHRIFTIMNCKAFSTHFRTSDKSLHKRRVCCPNDDDGHGVRKASGLAP